MRLSFPRTSCAPVFLVFISACTSPPASEPAAVPAPLAVHAPVAVPAAKAVEPTKPAPAQALMMNPQPGWIAEQPSSDKRKAQFRLPHADNDSEDASLVVYFFGGQGGSREANLERWAGQFEQPDGTPSSNAMKSSIRTIAGLEVFDASLSGTYVAETAPGSGVHVNKPDWRMLTSIVDASDGPWYFKLVGPASTVAKWEASYAAFMNSIRPGH